MESFQFYHYWLFKENNALIIHSDVVLKEKSFLQDHNFQFIQKQHLRVKFEIHDIIMVIFIELSVGLITLPTIFLFFNFISSNVFNSIIFLILMILEIYLGYLLSASIRYEFNKAFDYLELHTNLQKYILIHYTITRKKMKKEILELKHPYFVFNYKRNLLEIDPDGEPTWECILQEDNRNLYKISMLGVSDVYENIKNLRLFLKDYKIKQTRSFSIKSQDYESKNLTSH